MANQFSSKNTFKFVDALYKKAKVKAYRDMLERHQVASKHEFIRRAVDYTLKSTSYWMAGYSDTASRIKRANELWKCGIECHAVRHFSTKELKITSFKKLDINSGLLALLKVIYYRNRKFYWSDLILDTKYKNVEAAYENYQSTHSGWTRYKHIGAYANNYYGSYRSWLHKIGAIRPTERKGLWEMTQFGKDMALELLEYYADRSSK